MPSSDYAWVVFTPAKQKHWWDWLVERNYQHCYLVITCAVGFIKINPDLNLMNFNLYTTPDLQDPIPNGDIEEFVKSEICENSEVIRVGLDKPPSPRYTIEPKTCVTITKTILGVFWPFIQTPKGLRDKLLSSGLGKVV